MAERDAGEIRPRVSDRRHRVRQAPPSRTRYPRESLDVLSTSGHFDGLDEERRGFPVVEGRTPSSHYLSAKIRHSGRRRGAQRRTGVGIHVCPGKSENAADPLTRSTLYPSAVFERYTPQRIPGVLHLVAGVAGRSAVRQDGDAGRETTPPRHGSPTEENARRCCANPFAAKSTKSPWAARFRTLSKSSTPNRSCSVALDAHAGTSDAKIPNAPSAPATTTRAARTQPHALCATAKFTRRSRSSTSPTAHRSTSPSIAGKSLAKTTSPVRWCFQDQRVKRKPSATSSSCSGAANDPRNARHLPHASPGSGTPAKGHC